MASSARQSGFTLMEVLIALAILGIGMLAVISTANTSTRNALALKQRTLAHWVAMNEAARLQLSTEWPDTGTQNGTEDLAGETWRWTADISDTAAPNLRRADITVALDDKPDADISTLIVFIGKPSAHGLPVPNKGTGNGPGTPPTGAPTK